MNQKRQYKTDIKAFKVAAMSLLIDQDLYVQEVIKSLGSRANLLNGWS
jgi:hypothetical protein